MEWVACRRVSSIYYILVGDKVKARQVLVAFVFVFVFVMMASLLL